MWNGCVRYTGLHAEICGPENVHVVCVTPIDIAIVTAQNFISKIICKGYLNVGIGVCVFRGRGGGEGGEELQSPFVHCKLSVY